MSKEDDSRAASYDARKVGRYEFSTILLFWPTVTLLFLFLIFMMAVSITSFTEYSLQETQTFISDLFSSDQERFNSAPSFAYLGTVVAITIGIAFWLPSTGVSALPESSQHIVRFVWVSIVVSASLLSAFIVVALLTTTAKVDGILLLASAWFATLLAGLINLKRPTSELLNEAKKEREDQIRVVESQDFYSRWEPNPRISRMARAKFWVFPLLFSLAPMGALALSLQSEFWKDAIAFGMLPVLATALFQCGWFVKPHYFPGTGMDRFKIGVFYVVAMLILAAVVTVAFITNQWLVGIVTSVVWLGLATFFLIPTVSKRSKAIAIIRSEETRRRMQQTERWLDHVRSEHEEHLSKQNPRTSKGENPLIRIELFRRK